MALGKHIPGPNISKSGFWYFSPEDEPALRRLGFLRGRWDQMNWYVELTTKNLSQCSEGEWTILQEDVLALHRTLSHNIRASLPTRQALVDFHSEISRHCVDLSNGGKIQIGPLELTHEIQVVPRFSSKNNQSFSMAEFLKQSNQPMEGEREVRYIPRLPPRDWRTWLLDHFGRLAGEFGASIRSCLKCSKLFLQFRKNAQFCGRVCQNRTSAEAARMRKRIEKANHKSAKGRQKKSINRK